MEINKKLSIVIPTYNRADFLDYNLEVHIPMLKEYGIEIAIFDNASTDNTQEVVSKWMKEYKFLNYHKNETNIGPDANFEKALKYPNTDYVWLLGDTTQFNLISIETVLSYILDAIKYDLLILNDTNRVKDIVSQVFTDHNNLLLCLGWHMTQMSGLIYSKTLLNKADFKRYAKTNFIQTGIIFEELSKMDNFNVQWIQEISIVGFKKNNLIKKSWESVTFEIWMKNWMNFIFSLPPKYSLQIKLETIKKHNDLTGLFGIKNLLKMKLNGHYTFQDYYNYRPYFQLGLSESSDIKFLSPFIVPNFIIRLLKRLKNVK